MTGFTYDAQQFDKWISCNYDNLLRYCRRYRIEYDELNETYLNVKNRILISGYTGNQYMTFVKRSLRNLNINESKKLKNKYFVDIDNEDYTNTVENTLQEVDETEKDTQLYREEVLYLSKMIFKYIEEKKYNSEWCFVFRCYYLMPQRFTYKKLKDMTGIHMSQCTTIIKTMKKDIRTEFLIWLKKQNNVRG